jgi:hypothetical protein
MIQNSTHIQYLFTGYVTDLHKHSHYITKKSCKYKTLRLRLRLVFSFLITKPQLNRRAKEFRSSGQQYYENTYLKPHWTSFCKKFLTLNLQS